MSEATANELTAAAKTDSIPDLTCLQIACTFYQLAHQAGHDCEREVRNLGEMCVGYSAEMGVWIRPVGLMQFLRDEARGTPTLSALRDYLARESATMPFNARHKSVIADFNLNTFFEARRTEVADGLDEAEDAERWDGQA